MAWAKADPVDGRPLALGAGLLDTTVGLSSVDGIADESSSVSSATAAAAESAKVVDAAGVAVASSWLATVSSMACVKASAAEVRFVLAAASVRIRACSNKEQKGLVITGDENHHQITHQSLWLGTLQGGGNLRLIQAGLDLRCLGGAQCGCHCCCHLGALSNGLLEDGPRDPPAPLKALGWPPSGTV